ncbi:hypothetical protein EJ04DRAFT_355315 [Polyplosphaeria fusca]|uniref:Uncharacterized protein n=1 Tax=Polyplosphaeria fusca TaxID=682080 RepID=A0A9P4R5I6_9PLEO|nr:hypothetical protein EJ04DRAFT_355315 [Polyplosphaeria fusca]
MSSMSPRRFKVEPIETSTRSSKEQPAKEPQPIETPGKPSRDQSKDTEMNSKPRRFAPQPIETSHKTARKFAPEPIETTVKSSRDKFAKEWAGKDSEKPPRRFKPELIETSANNSRSGIRDKPRIGSSSSVGSSDSQRRGPRKFAPQLIETAKRSRKAGDARPAVLASDKTEATPNEAGQGSRKLRIDTAPPPPENSPAVEASQNPFFLEVKRQASPVALRRPPSRASTRSHHSFRVPELDPIESSGSEGSTPASPSTSPSNMSDHSVIYKEATRMRESVDERFSGYLLELAARAAEKQLQDQAMAAFPNDDYHEPVQHFVDRDDDAMSQVEETKRRRDSSFTEVNWDLEAMRQFSEESNKKQQRENDQNRRREPESQRANDQARNPWGDAAAYIGNSPTNNAAGGYQKDGELDRMRKGARPPMLGGDIKFPRCPSPEPARFDPTQGTQAVKSAMCYLTEQSQASERGEGLWCGSGKKSSTTSPLLWANGQSRPPSRGGLWAGCCVNTGLTPPRGPTGILTPQVEVNDPFSPCPTPNAEQLPPTPPASQEDFACIDEKLAAEVVIEKEFGDDFVTQVYNYLSLGYPSVARTFDAELSRISHFTLEELRQDDHLPTSRGYIRLGADGNLTNTEITEESCVRWRGLRAYVHVWARQQPGMDTGDSTIGVGVAVRRGSWAI